MDLIVHHSIADLYKTLGMPINDDIGFTVLSVPDIHNEIPFTSPKLRANYFSFILTIKGSGEYYLDDNRFPFGAESFYFTNPGHLKSYKLNTSEKAYIITLTEVFLTENVHPEIFNEFPFLLAEIVPPKELNPADLNDFEMLYAQIMNEFHKKSEFKTKILGNLFTVLLLKIKEKFWSAYNPIDEGNRNSQIVKSFKQLLEIEFKKLLHSEQNGAKIRVQDIADSMSLHPNYLNSVIKSKTGKTINEWLADRTLSAAKNLLLGSSLSSKEIAFKLGFSEPTHFGRFFKKQTQLSPSAFRKMNM